MECVRIGKVRVSRFILGSNPFSGFSHQGAEMDRRMVHYYTTARIKETLREAEGLGINTVVARADHHVMRVLMEYWDEGGTLQWFAQTCPELGTIERGIENAVRGGAKACHIHGGVMDYLLAQGKTGEVPGAIAKIREAGLPAGIAGHNPEVFEWAEGNVDADYYMCSYYNSAHRDERAEHVSGLAEWFLEEDRRVMTELIQNLSRPAIHYKVLAAGRNDPREAFECVARNMRANDAVCVGVYTEGKPGVLREDVEMFLTADRRR
ncbi:MAG: hypothetical protein V2A58_04035 [Planctomycetota bacterium]